MKVKKLVTIYLIIITILVSIALVNIAIAKNKTSIRENSKVEIAKPIIEIEQLQEVETITENTECKNFYFKVKNYNNSETSQIAQKYKLEISTENPETINNLNFELISTNMDYSQEEQVNLTDNKSEQRTLIANEKQDNFFIIKIKDVNSNYSYKDSMFINIISESIEL